MTLQPASVPRQLHPFDLQLQVLKADGVVAVHRPLKLQREDQVQILAWAGTNALPRCAGAT